MPLLLGPLAIRYGWRTAFLATGAEPQAIHYQAVAETLGIRWRGKPAWFLARTYHLSQMPGWQEGAVLSAQRTLGQIASRVSQSVAERRGARPAA